MKNVKVDYDSSTVLSTVFISINLRDQKSNEDSEDDSLKEVKDYVHTAVNEVKSWKAKLID
jgi:hypothetical protein